MSATKFDEWGNPIFGNELSSYGELAISKVVGGRSRLFYALNMELDEVVSFIEVVSKHPLRELLDGVPIGDISLSISQTHILAEVIGAYDYARAAATKNIHETVICMDRYHREFEKGLFQVLTMVQTHIISRTYVAHEIMVVGDALNISIEKVLGEILSALGFQRISIETDKIERVNTTDSRKAGPLKVGYESIAITHELSATPKKFIANAIVLVDSSQRIALKRISEYLRMYPREISHPHKVGVEGIALTDSRIAHPRGIKVEIVNLGDIADSMVIKILRESLRSIHARSIVISHTIADSIRPAIVLVKHPASRRDESVTLTETSGRTLLSRIIKNKIAVSDYRITEPIKFITNALSVADSISHTRLRILAETIVIEELPQLRKFFKNEFIRFKDSRVITISRTFAAESLRTISTKLSRIQRTRSETISLSDSRWTRFVRYIKEHLHFIDYFSRNFGQIFIETITLTEQQSRSFVKELDDILHAFDTRSSIAYLRLNDRLNLHTRINSISSFLRVESIYIANSLHYSNIIKRLKEIVYSADIRHSFSIYRLEKFAMLDRRSIRSMKLMPAEVLSAVDRASRLPFKVFVETVGTVDHYIPSVRKFVTERLRTFDVRKSIVVFAVSDLLVFVDRATHTATKNFTEVLQLVDSRMSSAARYVSERLKMIKPVMSRSAIIEEGEVLSISDRGVRKVRRSVAEALTVGDSLSRALRTARTEIVFAMDLVHKEYSKVIAEKITTSDLARSFLGLFRRHGSAFTLKTRESRSIVLKDQEANVSQITEEKEVDE
jgi:hypothetical protein